MLFFSSISWNLVICGELTSRENAKLPHHNITQKDLLQNFKLPNSLLKNHNLLNFQFLEMFQISHMSKTMLYAVEELFPLDLV